MLKTGGNGKRTEQCSYNDRAAVMTKLGDITGLSNYLYGPFAFIMSAERLGVDREGGEGER